MFDTSKVTSVYSGRKGCACGCRGKYTRSSKHPADEAPTAPVNDRVVAQTVAKVEEAMRSGVAAFVMVDAEWIAVDMPHDRTYTVYFCD